MCVHKVGFENLEILEHIPNYMHEKLDPSGRPSYTYR